MPVGANKAMGQGLGGQKATKPVAYGEVLDIILDDSHESYDVDQSFTIGCCRVRLIPEDNGKEPELCQWYMPHSMSDIELPLIGEIVTLITSAAGGLGEGGKNSTTYYWLKTAAIFQELHNNNVALSTAAEDGNELVPPLGRYTEETLHFPLGMLEGDKILAGRYGQVIRFTTPPGSSPLSPWWKTGSTGAPVLSISTGNDVTSESSVEDIETGSHIVLSDGVLIKNTTVPHSDPHILIKSEKVTLHSTEWKADLTMLLDIVKDLVASVETLSKGTFPTGVGPTGPHPSEVATMAQIKQRLSQLEA